MAPSQEEINEALKAHNDGTSFPLLSIPTLKLYQLVTPPQASSVPI
jgi:hypothetical protein